MEYTPRTRLRGAPREIDLSIRADSGQGHCDVAEVEPSASPLPLGLRTGIAASGPFPQGSPRSTEALCYRRAAFSCESGGRRRSAAPGRSGRMGERQGIRHWRRSWGVRRLTAAALREKIASNVFGVDAKPIWGLGLGSPRGRPRSMCQSHVSTPPVWRLHELWPGLHSGPVLRHPVHARARRHARRHRQRRLHRQPQEPDHPSTCVWEAPWKLYLAQTVAPPPSGPTFGHLWRTGRHISVGRALWGSPIVAVQKSGGAAQDSHRSGVDFGSNGTPACARLLNLRSGTGVLLIFESRPNAARHRTTLALDRPTLARIQPTLARSRPKLARN